jgi:hypothetical protein
MSKKKTNLETLEAKLTQHLQALEAMFPKGINISIIGTDTTGAQREFVISSETPANLISALKRTTKRIAQEDKEQKGKRL